VLVSYGFVGLLWLDSNHEDAYMIVFSNRAKGLIRSRIGCA
jgi:hypothetical protein